MAQKTKVKELVGRGLNSYHTKALQQIHRIEKKNKEQNHKISILSNELDNDYLTKTEEGSVVSLEHSKEGMVYLDELQGNTLVNYCTDGSKELTLNGDIDVEGTFVTTTEGVDGGKIDVMCEGNTLVNKLYKIKDYGSITEFRNHGWGSTSNCPNYEWIDNGIKIKALSSDTQLDRYYRSSPDKYGIFKKNRTYIVRMNVNSNNLQQNATILRCFYGNGTTFITGQMSEVVNGVFIKKATTSSTVEEVDAIHSMISLDYRTPQGVDGWVSFQNVMVIDVTDLPSYQQDVEYWRNIEYFEGMKSVGQDDENGHKIEILSRNKNLFDKDNAEYSRLYISGVGVNGEGTYVDASGLRSVLFECKKDTQYTISKLNGYAFRIFGSIQKPQRETVGKCLYINNSGTVATINSGSYNYLQIVYYSYNSENTGEHTEQQVIDSIQIEYGSVKSDYIQHKSNKKEILINEPLVGNSTVKDKVIKIGGKWFVEKLWKTVTLDGTQEIIKGAWDVPIFSYNVPNTEGEPTNFPNTLMCDRIKPQNFNLSDNTHWALYTGKDTVASKRYIRIQIPASIVAKDDLEGFKTWLRNNPVTIAYRLNTPIYEPLEIEPTLNTYNDITHISNNSIIPCNMKIQNSGYNAIIKPSTLYTVALDTNKSGTIGMNLGGMKTVTTNNVAIITTPAILSDDSLRLFGKGIKGSKVRLLEGDKTNWIPSHFEGMKSSFEDKVQADGTYKMEILSHNKNLIDYNQHISKNGQVNYEIDRDNSNIVASSSGVSGTWQNIGIGINVKNEKTYTLSYENIEYQSTNGVNVDVNSYVNIYEGKPNRRIANIKYNTKNTTFTIPKDVNVNDLRIRIHVTQRDADMATIKIKGLMLTESVQKLDFAPPIYNKIQFSSIEPLRKWDRFVFKDNQLMIERGSLSFTVDNSRTWIYDTSIASPYYKCNIKDIIGAITQDIAINNILCDKLPIKQVYTSNSNYGAYVVNGSELRIRIEGFTSKEQYDTWLAINPLSIICTTTTEPTYEEIPFELQKIILEGYENGTLFFDTNIPPTSTVTYAGETPIVKSVKLNKTEVSSNTDDINDNIIPYLMDMDYRVVMLQLATEEIEGGVSMARLFGGTYEMIKRDILSKRLTREEYGYRLADYFNAGKLTEEQVRELEDLR